MAKKVEKPRILFQAYIDFAQYEYIVRKAEETKRSRASVLREIISQHVEMEKEKGSK